MALPNNPNQLDVVKTIKDLEKDKLDTSKGVTIDTEQTIEADKTFAHDVVIKRRLTVYDETNKYNCWVQSYALDGFKFRLVKPLQTTALPLEVMKLSSDGSNTIQLGNSDVPLTFTGSNTKPTYNGHNLALESDIPTKTSQLTNDSGFMTSSTVPNNFQPAPNHLGTPTTPPNDSLWTPAKSGWVMFSCTSHTNGAEFYLKLNSSTGLMVGCSLGTGGGSMSYNNCPSMTVPVQAGKTYYVHYSSYSAHYYSS